MNAVHLVGRVKTEPKMSRTIEAGQTVVKLLLLTHESWKDRKGDRQERSDVHRLVFWGGAAVVVAERVLKGDVIGVDGKLQARDYADKLTGEARHAVEVIVTRLHLLDDPQWYGDPA